MSAETETKTATPSVELTPAQVHELDRLHAEVSQAYARAMGPWQAYEEVSSRMFARVQEILWAAGVAEEERKKEREWRMVVDGDAVRLVPAEGGCDGHGDRE